MRRVYDVPTLAEAWLLHELLASVGIETLIFNQHGAGAVGELPCDSGWPQLWVRRDHQYQHAREVLLEHERRARDDSRRERECRGCGEPNPGSFDCCWHCGRDLDR